MILYLLDTNIIIYILKEPTGPFQLERNGQIIGANDLMIAAIALCHGLTLLTHNSDEFGRVSALKVDDWVRPGI